LIPPDRFDEEDRIMAQNRSGERVDHFETMRIRKDGTRINVAVTVSPILDSESRVVGASNVTRDISARKRAEYARNTIEARLDFALKTSQIGAWELILDDKRMTYLSWLESNVVKCTRIE
jgi:hypothetical protein